jgi:hypothetical protein
MFTHNSVFADLRPTVVDANGGDVQSALVTGTHTVALGAGGRTQGTVVRSTPRQPAAASSTAGVRHAQP